MVNELDHTYTLVAEPDAAGEARVIELHALEPFAAMNMAQRELPGREIELLEDGQSLGRMKCTREGFWVVLPFLLANHHA